MVRCTPAVLLVLLAACQDLPGRPPTRDEFDPKGVKPGAPPPLPSIDTGESEKILAEYAQRYKGGFPIYPDDELRFTVLGQPDLSFEAKVPADGSIHYPLIGPVALSGRTLEEIRGEIKGKLEKDYLVSAQVTVQVRAYATKRVYVSGSVAHPKEYEVPSGRFSTLLQAVTQAGGFLEDAARHGVVIFRPREVGSADRVAMTVNVVAIQEGRGRDPVILPNDVIFVPSREKVFVLGQVTRPGAFVVSADQVLTATQAVALAGGYTRVANDSNVRLIRRGKTGRSETFVLNLARVVGGHAAEDVPLQPGDTLFVPESIF